MATPEGKVKSWLDTMLKAEKGVWFFPPQAGPYGGVGVHDRIGCAYGLFFSAEAKADKTCKMTARQELLRDKIEAAGGKFFLVYDKETIEEVRQWIVSARNSRQESIGVVHGGSRQGDSCNSDSEASAQFFGGSPSPLRGNESPSQPGL